MARIFPLYLKIFQQTLTTTRSRNREIEIGKNTLGNQSEFRPNVTKLFAIMPGIIGFFYLFYEKIGGVLFVLALMEFFVGINCPSGLDMTILFFSLISFAFRARHGTHSPSATPINFKLLHVNSKIEGRT